ncbi:MAG TPA: carboxylate--amine ligase/circularly permuted type 2 ATP-grasp protein [Aldersonia sp.]
MAEQLRNLGVEEEFQLIDATTRRLTARAPELLELLPDDIYVEELQRCVVETNSRVFSDLAALRADLVAHRRVLRDAAAQLGIGVAAAGAVPLSVPAEMEVTETPRYRRMLADYQLLAREQLICGTQVHVELPDRDEAVAVANRVAPYLPIFLALSASSPFWSDGSDTGYASVRTLVWLRWPTTGAAPFADSGTEYDAMIADLVASGVITDPGMVYFDVRPSARLPTLELRVCDSCPSVDTIVLIAGLYRALVNRELAGLRAGEPGLHISPTLTRGALWRAARSGLEDELVDITAPAPMAAGDLVRRFVDDLRPQLAATGDEDVVAELADRALLAGSSASRQRRALRRRGRLTDVVDLLMDETSGEVAMFPHIKDPDQTLLHGYLPLRSGGAEEPGYDEAIEPNGTVRREYVKVLAGAAGSGAAALRQLQFGIEHEQSVEGMTFRVSGEGRAQLFPMDIVPRIVTGDDWAALVPGLAQRALALDAFIADVYGERAAVRDGIVPSEVIDRAPGLRESGFASASARVRTHICGIDLVSDGRGRWLVLEDNLRVPSGIAYALANRRLMASVADDIPMPESVRDISGMPAMIRDTLLAAAPPAAPDNVGVAVLSSGWEDSAWFEHKTIAELADVPLVQTQDLSVRDDVVYRHTGRDAHRIDVLYARMDEDMLLSSAGHDDRALRPGLMDAIKAGTLTIANALGNGVGDDKAVYAYVPALIEYFLGQKPILEQVPTYLCAERAQRDFVLGRLDSLVVKPVDGFGGSGITIGPEASDAELAARRVELKMQPERFIAQDVVHLSTHPTFDGTGFHPHHVDLRAFVHLRPGRAGPTPHVAPAALTRVAPPGSMIVNSSKGGGGKDTWILQ